MGFAGELRTYANNNFLRRRPGYGSKIIWGKEQEEIIEVIKDHVANVMMSVKMRSVEEFMREFEKVVVLRAVDSKWMDHIDAMDQLRQGIHFVLTAEQIRCVKYQFEGFEMFQEMINNIQEEVAMYIMKAHVRKQPGASSGGRRSGGKSEDEAGDEEPPVRSEEKELDATTHVHAAAGRNSSSAMDKAAKAKLLAKPQICIA